MLKDFLLKKMLQSQMKGIPEAQKMQMMNLFLKNQDFFKKIALEIQEEAKKGLSTQEAGILVANRYKKELEQMKYENT